METPCWEETLQDTDQTYWSWQKGFGRSDSHCSEQKMIS